MRYFLTLSYLGAPYHGWQCQPGAISVQEVIETAMSRLMGRPMKITGAGRTDAGVNARKMVAHFDTDVPIRDTQRFVASLNAMVGRDIAIQRVEEVAPTLHARFDATSRTYHYYAMEEKSPFFHTLSWKAPRGLDYDAMNRAAELLLTTTDFTSFAKLHTDAKTNICHVTHVRWHRIESPEGGAWVFIITADRFLRNMVRALVGTLVEVGRGKIDLEGFRAIIEKRDRCAAGTSMPAHALYLWDVTY